MKRVDIQSVDFQLAMACHYLKEHKREKQLVVNNSVSELILTELERRGCRVVRDFRRGLCTISSPVPFGQLVTDAEWKQDRAETLQAVGWGVLLIGGSAGAF